MSSYYRSFDKDFSALVDSKLNATVFIDEETGEEFSWVKLQDIVSQIQGWLDGNNVKPGQVILSLLPNSVEALALFIACIRYGYCYAPLPPSASSREIQQLCNMVSPALAVILADADDRFENLTNRPQTHLIKLDLEFKWVQSANTGATVDKKKNKSGKLYMATSGSTGTPKLLVIDGDKLWSSGCAFVAEHPFLGGDSCFYNIMPMSYLGGLFNLGLIPLASGGKVLIAPAFSGSTVLRFWQEVMRYGVTTLWLTPTMLRSLVKVIGPRWADISKTELKVDNAFLGTAPIDILEKESFENIFGIPVLENYGLSETTFISCEKPANRGSRIQHSVGQDLPWVDVRLTNIVGENGNTKLSKIEVRTPFLIDGYIQSKGEFLPVKSNDWFDTGDIGHLDDGSIVLDGRTRDVIKKGGVLIHLPEIETLMREYPDLEDVATVDISHTFYGEDYVLFLVFNGTSSNDVKRLDDARAFLTNNLVQTKWPAHIIPVKEIPRTISGKVARNELQKLVKEQK